MGKRLSDRLYDIIKGKKLKCKRCGSIYSNSSSFSHHLDMNCQARIGINPLFIRGHHKKHIREVISCDCGFYIDKEGAAKHLGTKRRQDWLSNLIKNNKLEVMYDKWKEKSQNLINEVTLKGIFKVTNALLKHLVYPDNDKELSVLVDKKTKEDNM